MAATSGFDTIQNFKGNFLLFNFNLNHQGWAKQYFFCIHPPPELLTVLGPLERYMTPTLDAALL